MAIWLKEGKSESEIIEADEKVKRTVEGILNDVSKREMRLLENYL